MTEFLLIFDVLIKLGILTAICLNVMMLQELLRAYKELNKPVEHNMIPYDLDEPQMMASWEDVAALNPNDPGSAERDFQKMRKGNPWGEADFGDEYNGY